MFDAHPLGYFQVRYDSRVVIYDRRAFIRLAKRCLNGMADLTIIMVCRTIVILPAKSFENVLLRSILQIC